MAIPNAEYWAERFTQLESVQNRDSAEYYNQVAREMEKAQRAVQAKIDAWYGRFADNNNISIQEAKKLLNSRELKELKWDIETYIEYGKKNAIDGSWKKQLENASARAHISRLEAIQLQTQQQIEALYGNYLDSFDTFIKDTYQNERLRTAFEIQKGIGIGSRFDSIDTDKLETLIKKPWAVDGENFSTRIWKSKNQLINNLHTQLVQTCILGQSVDKSASQLARLTHAYDLDFRTAKSQSARLINTEGAYFSTLSRKNTFQELDVEEYEIVSTLDNKTSEICQDMDGKHFPVSQMKIGVNAPPFHVNCRTTTVPYFNDEFTEDDVRIARGEDGQTYYIPANMTYKEWENSFVKGDTKDLKPTGSKTNKIVKTIADCKTTEDVAEFIKEQKWFRVAELRSGTYDTNESIKLDGVDLDVAKTLYENNRVLFEKYPKLAGELNSFNSAQLRPKTYAQCSYGLGHGGIAVNSKWFNDFEKLKKKYEDDLAYGFHPKGTDFTSIYVHEFGHALDDYMSHTLKAVGMNGWKPKTVSAYLRPKVMKACKLKISDIAKEVSVYATQDAQEWFAECFAEYICSANPRQVAKEFGKQLEELMKGSGLL